MYLQLILHVSCTIKSKIRQLVSTMNSLRSRNKNFKDLNSKQQKLLTAVRAGGLNPSPSLFKKLRHNIHAQRGIKERFRKGIMRSGLYLKEIEQREIFKKRVKRYLLDQYNDTVTCNNPLCHDRGHHDKYGGPVLG